MEAGRNPAYSIREALQMVESIKALSQKAQEVPGLAEGELENVLHRANRILQNYAKLTRRTYRAFKRDLDDLASDVSELYKEGLLLKKHLRILDRMLNKMKMRDFYSARKLLRKFDDFVALRQEIESQLGEYRKFYQQLRRELEQRKTKLSRLHGVLRPALSPREVKDVTSLLLECKELVNRLISDYLSTYPSREVLRTMFWAATMPNLKIPAPSKPQPAEAMLNLLDSAGDIKNKFGDKNMHALMEAAGYTDARFAHILKDHRHLKRLLLENRSWLRALSTTKGYGPNFSIEDDVDTIRPKIASWLEMLKRIPRSTEAEERLNALSEMLDSGTFANAQEAAQVYQRFGDAARRAWDGSLQKTIKETEEMVSRLLRDLERLPHPDKVIEIGSP